MSRSLKVRSDCIQQVKDALRRNRFPRQQDLADEVGKCLDTISKYLNGRPVDFLNFLEISERLGLNWQDIADFDVQEKRPPVEDICYQELLKPGALVRITAPRRMGKTALIAGTILKFAQQGYQTVYFNFGLAEQNDFSDLERFLKWFCGSVGNKLKLENQLANPKYWDENLSSKIKCTSYFEEYLLAQVKTPLILGLDDIHRVFPYQAIASEYLSLLRVWHEEAKSNQVWQQLRLVLAYPSGIDIPFTFNESPFNVGFPINLPEFTLRQL